MSGRSGPDFYEEYEIDKIDMLEACMQGRIDEVRKCISGGKVSVDESDSDGVTALQIAAAKGHKQLVCYLVSEENASIDLANNAGMTPFLHACREGHREVVATLINYRANINLLTGLGVSALTLACAGKHMEVVKILKTMQRQLTAIPTVPSVPPNAFMGACFNRDIDMCGYLSHNFKSINSEVAGLSLGAVNFIRSCGLNYILGSMDDTKCNASAKREKLESVLGDVELLTTVLRCPHNSLEPLPEDLTLLM